MIVYFVRHGQTEANIANIFAGSRIDTPLTARGIEQAELAAQALQGKPFDIVVTSPLIRAKHTAERITDKLGYKGEVLVEPLLAERDFGAASGTRWDETGHLVDAGTVEDLETEEQLAERMQQLLDWFATLEAEHVLAVGHGSAEAMLQAIYLGQHPATHLTVKELGNAEVREYQLKKR